MDFVKELNKKIVNKKVNTINNDKNQDLIEIY